MNEIKEIKKKWYRNNFVKTALIVIEIMLFAAACVGVGVFAGMYSNRVPGDSSVYALSRRFADEVFAESSHEILNEINYEMRYAKLREQGEAAVVDLQEISEKASADVNDILDHLTWKNVSGLAYSVEDLKKRLDMVEQELREYKENEEASAKDGNYTSNQETK